MVVPLQYRWFSLVDCNMTLIHQHFYGLLRMAVCGTPYEVSPMADEDWIALYRLAQQQSLTAVV